MEKDQKSFVSRMPSSNSVIKLFGGVVAGALVLGTLTGYVIAKTNNNGSTPSISSPLSSSAPKSASADQQTFRDFAEGVIQKKPETNDYSEGTHLLVRQGAQSVALTSSVVDLNQYVGKQVEVFGETQKAVKEGWLMDVGKVEVK